ncbi:MAG: hypothetical protein A3E07_02150 [Candidatus Wildermuthbacteria bacterium RIFCSPHIGHO2_12_FULL_45_9]|uniref:Uncharacterized protein n=1 Tax=Candidatus Wildermuthbacteria bacterium RIFCSPHIGHO2_02_FULL_45_25 TaxID=1802450 RepID=A0A1G2R497_9BACT|nr:MAG: hypothetical protein A2748_00635 [Candidatus Wildermuthbacteria bacterium RIFCSPHIGHO2_01_FULL_45_20]OHA67685.1 MAG: hypothetical protein A3C04_02095 [Candidatus Wildermuthbacteria bacterium RIFCSPHIGHO2_02_FULL_45_25]OHA71000.1 MAG: hypothetical protein A3E07_02150 [Candidatus Wildermuthbacteria bacterium RIFCSPHIGHO2_12_FULL_45_9]
MRKCFVALHTEKPSWKEFCNSKFFHTKGQSLLEVILALALFALFVTAFGSLATGGFTALTRGDEYAQAGFVAQEGMEALLSIRNKGWNELKYSESGVDIQNGEWTLKGEGSFDIAGNFTRTIFLYPVCLDASNQITSCPGLFTDAHSKQAIVRVQWETSHGQSQELMRTMYLANWESKEWIEDTEGDFSDGTFNGTAISPVLGDGDGAITLQEL